MMNRTIGLRLAAVACVGFVVLVVSPLGRRAAAQQPTIAVASVARSVSGTVADAAGNPLNDAEITLRRTDSTARPVRSDANGRFRIDALPDGAISLRVRRMGFQERTVPVKFVADRTATVFVTLDEAVAALDPVSVDVEGPETNTKLREFYARERSNHFGYFLDEEQLAEIHPEQTSDALRAVPGVLVRPSRRIGNEVRIRGCSPLVWVDGLRAPNGELDELTRGSDVAAMEIYNS
ncbi:MAG: TonB-dependent receptor, partial [Gemmatimonadaceae bacterium]